MPQSVDIEGLVRHDPLQPAVLDLQGLEPVDLRDFHVSVLGLPAVEGAFTDPMATAEILGGCPGVGLFQYGDDLLLGEPFPLHGPSSLESSVYPRRTLFQVGLKSGGQVSGK